MIMCCVMRTVKINISDKQIHACSYAVKKYIYSIIYTDGPCMRLLIRVSRRIL